jgi:hypothetical protein
VFASSRLSARPAAGPTLWCPVHPPEFWNVSTCVHVPGPGHGAFARPSRDRASPSASSPSRRRPGPPGRDGVRTRGRARPGAESGGRPAVAPPSYPPCRRARRARQGGTGSHVRVAERRAGPVRGRGHPGTHRPFTRASNPPSPAELRQDPRRVAVPTAAAGGESDRVRGRKTHQRMLIV